MRLSERARGWAAVVPRLAYWAAILLTVAGLTHLSTVLVQPYRSPHDAYTRMAAITGGATLKTVALGPQADIPYRDPALAAAVCLYDLRTGPIRASLDVTGADLAILAVYGRHGQVLYGLTSRSATHDRLALTIVRPGASGAASPGGAGAPADIRIETDEPTGFVMAQALAVAPSAMPEASALASRLACTVDRPPATAALPRAPSPSP